MSASEEGAALRSRREAAGLTRREAAALARVNCRTIARIEGGRRAATPGLARWLLRCYDTARPGGQTSWNRPN